MSDVAPAIRYLGDTRPYIDGAEDLVTRVLESATDRGSGSDELASQVVDWPSAYHFDRRRANILRPFRFTPGLRVLEVGAGTGALTRYLGETCGEVVALEGDAVRARTVALRCAGLDNVEVVCGPFELFEDSAGFDVIVVVGVLEYAGLHGSRAGAHLSFLQCARQLLKDSGVLILGIENQLGLKYILGFNEDHLAVPWEGIEGYPGNPGVRTFARRPLATLLEGAGLTEQKWFYPYPDYKMPAAILSEEIFGLPTATDIVDQLVTAPVRDFTGSRHRACDDRASHLGFVAAGLGPEVASSFLVVAAPGVDGLTRLGPSDALAWHFSGERLKRWCRHQTLCVVDDQLWVRSQATYASVANGSGGWLKHDPHKDDPWVIGRTLEQKALDACHDHDMPRLEEVLRCWRQLLSDNETGGTGELATHPFLPERTPHNLPGNWLDVSLSNFLDTGTEIQLVDREWLAGDGVDTRLAAARALWYFAKTLVFTGAANPFPPLLTINDIACRLGELCGETVDAHVLELYLHAEAQFQSVVSGADADAAASALAQLGATSRTHAIAQQELPFTFLRRCLAEASEWAHGLADQLERCKLQCQELMNELDIRKQSTGELESELEQRRDLVCQLEAALEAARASELQQEGSITALERELGDLKAWKGAFERRLPVRILRRLQRFLRS